LARLTAGATDFVAAWRFAQADCLNQAHANAKTARLYRRAAF